MKSFRGSSSCNEPHHHDGKITPFQPGDPGVDLDEKAIDQLSQGKPYQCQIQLGTAGRGVVVQDVHAPTHVVWDRILDYNNYASMIPTTCESKNYLEQTDENGRETFYTNMKVGVALFKLEFFVKHIYDPKLQSLTWTLDYSKKSDFDDLCGHWHIIPHPDKPEEWSRAFFSVEVCIFGWVPKFVVDWMSAKALTDSTAWVKKFSELEYANMAAQVESPEEMSRTWLWKKGRIQDEDGYYRVSPCASTDSDLAIENENSRIMISVQR